MSPYENNDVMINDPTFNQLVSAIKEMKLKGIDETDSRYTTTLQILKYYLYKTSCNNKSLQNNNNNNNSNSNNNSNNMIDDVSILKSQMESYKYLSRNLPIPAQLLSNLSPLLLNDNSIKPPEVIDLKFYSKGTLKWDPNQQQQQLQQQQQQQLQQQQQNSQQLQPLLINSNTTITSTGETVKNLHDAYIAIANREHHIHSKMQYRLEEIKELPNNIPEELKLKSQIEMKEIKLLELQSKLRNDIVHENNELIFQNSSSEIDLFVKPIPRLVTKPMDIMFAKQSSSVPESILITNKKKFLSALFNHHKEFKLYHSNNKREVTRNNTLIVKFFKEKEKREQERLRQERIRLLKARDTQGYRDLLTQTKNERLEMLMGQTDELLAKIDLMVQKEVETRAKERPKQLRQEQQLPANTTDNTINNTATTTPTTTTTTTTTTANNNSNTNIQSTTTLIQKKSMNNDDIMTQPEVMSGGKLKEYQITGLEWLVSLYKRDLNGILADEMGLGKTVQTIALISHLYEKLNVRMPFLIVAPLSTISNWSTEVLRWAPKLYQHTIIYKGKPEERKDLAKKIPRHAFGIVITSFEYILLDKKSLGPVQWCYVIVDEGHRIKNKQSKLSAQLRLYHSNHRLLLTGTPLQNDLGELWSLLNFLLPKIFDSKDTFENWFNAPFAAKGKQQVIGVNEEESLIIINRLHQVLRFFLLRRLKSDVESQLPEKTEIVIKCSLSALQIVMYRHLAERGSLPLDPSSRQYEKSTTKVKGFNNVVKQFQKICNHPYLFRDEWDINEDLIRTSGKFDIMDQILVKMHASGHRVLIFTQMTEVINLMEEYFSIKQWEFLRLDGSTKPEERGVLVHEWNRPDSPYWIFVLSTHAGGLGMNLQTADTVIIFDSDWNPQMDLQAQDRCHRIGQTNAVNVYRLICAKSIEEKILERATDKLEIDAKIIQAGMFNTHSNDQERRAKLEQFLHGFPSSTREEPTTDLSELNKLIARDDEEYHQFQEMDKQKELQEQKEAKRSKQPIKPRLFAENELPEWIKSIPEINKDDLTTPGKKRASAIQATTAVFDDLTERQYTRMVEKGMEIEEYKKYLAEKKSKKDKRNSGDDQDGEDISSDDSYDEDDEEEEEEEEEEESSEDDRKKRNTKKRQPLSANKRKLNGQRKSEQQDGDEPQHEGPEDHQEGTETTATTPAKGRRGRKKAKVLTEGEEDDTTTTTTTTTSHTGFNDQLADLPAKRTRKPINLKFSLNTNSLMKENQQEQTIDEQNGINGVGDGNGEANSTPYKPGRRSASNTPNSVTPKPKGKRGKKPASYHAAIAAAAAAAANNNNNNNNGSNSNGINNQDDTSLTIPSMIDETITGDDIQMEEEDDNIQSIFKKIWGKVHNAKEKSRKISELFWEKPDREDYPNYYEVIKNPIAMDDIQTKSYSTPEEYLQDWKLMFSNAQQFNDSTSQVYADATYLYNLVSNELKSHFENIIVPDLSPTI